MWKRLFALICLSGILLFFGISFVLAQGCPAAPDCKSYCANPCIGGVGLDPPGSTFCLCPPTQATSIEMLLENVINYIFWFATAITPILVLVGGFMFMTSAGDIKKVDTAKRIIWYTIVGYAIVLFSRGLVSLLASLLG